MTMLIALMKTATSQDAVFFSQTLSRSIIPLVLALLLNYVVQRYINVPKNLRSTKNTTYMAVIKSTLSVIIYLVGLYYMLIQLQINVTPLFASAGIIGLVLGLGVRVFIEDFFTGIFILTQDTIHVGDYVEISGTQGITESLGLRTIRIKDENGALHTFPNREIKKIVNYSRREARVVIDIPIKPNQKINKAISALLTALKKIKEDRDVGNYISDGSAVRGVEDIHQGKIEIRTLLLTRSSYRWDVARKYRLFALLELESQGIELA